MFRRIADAGTAPVAITVEGMPVSARAGDTVAAAMLAAGFIYSRTTPQSGSRRGPFCMMGTCFECLVQIDGVANQQACQTTVREGMTILRQQGAREIES